MRFLSLLTIWLNYMVKKKDGAEEKILAAARKVFMSKGMAGARMQDIADEAGINRIRSAILRNHLCEDI